MRLAKGKANEADQVMLTVRWNNKAQRQMRARTTTRRADQPNPTIVYHYRFGDSEGWAILANAMASGPNGTFSVLLPFLDVEPKWSTFKMRGMIPGRAL